MDSPNSLVGGGELCLICNSSFEWKPMLIEEIDSSSGPGQGSDFQNLPSAFLLLCKLLLREVDGKEEGVLQPLGEMFEVLLSPQNGLLTRPCCHDCYRGIMEVWKFQNLIDETVELQAEVVEELRRSLVPRGDGTSEPSSNVGDDDGVQMGIVIRNHLVNRLSARSQQATENILRDSENVTNEHRINHRKRKSAKPVNLISSESASTKLQKRWKETETSGSEEMTSITPKRRVGRPRKGEIVGTFPRPLPLPNPKREPEEQILGDESSVDSNPPQNMEIEEDDNPDPVWEPPGTDSDTGSELRTSSESEEEIPEPVTRTRGRGRPLKYRDPTLPKRKAGRPTKAKPRDGSPPQKKKMGRPRRGAATIVPQPKPKISNYFYILPNESLLLVRSTAIKFYFNERLECLEEGCDHVVEGTDKSSLEQMRAHMTTASHFKRNRESLRKCPLCSEEVSTLKTHMFREHPPVRILCEICWKPMKTRHPNLHLWTHKNEEEREAAIARGEAEKRRLKFICSQCGQGFPSRSAIRCHEETHLPEHLRQKHQCEFCGATLLTQNTLKTHIARRHQPDSDPRILSCRICDKKFHFRDKNFFEEHIRSHTNERPFVCDICGKSFRAKVMLRSHSVVHGTEKFKCEFCGQEFKHKRGMRRHQVKLHRDMVTVPDPEEEMKKRRLEDRPDFIGPRLMYPCQVCEKVFPLRCRMTKHVQTHHSHLYATLILGTNEVNC